MTKPTVKKTSRKPPAMMQLRSPRAEGPINPDHFYRRIDGPAYFGYAQSQLDEKIKTGEIPMPVALSDTGRACGWFEKTILAWQAGRVAKAMRVA